ncbi:hypothetical protein EMIHUDRAFT_119116 [Emiliania huxleyi CCMP1516]|uniref:FF domain-containing protein n=2 Tax=Emiliania huxleyi TaxID=2903 RepID=A0A0D3IY19_EMIH1|nr:hypothetical protein EMIHUDRAFT_119116 [Emiliania huxleyi CCMP1516]EOD16154.1 hypothetical protein EMIHUDRAFT_119116 [Emiliania huxleyi CCMP1516]|eukprot:XP_005768583.1 hypothetical protein EMIHUDRAFT_119116 [Emiliania huxleyi CCMP1516]
MRDGQRRPEAEQGKNNNKPVKRPSAPVDAEVEEGEKPFHSSVFEQERLNSLINAPERQTWDEFKETLRKKGEMDGDETRLQEEAQRRFRKELDEARTTRRARAARMGDGKGDSSAKEKRSKKEKKGKKEKKEKRKREKKKKRRRDASDSDSDSADAKKKKKSKDGGSGGGPVRLSSFFNGSSSDSDSS